MRATLESRSRGRMTGNEMQTMRREGYVPATISMRGGVTTSCSIKRDRLMDILQSLGRSAIIQINGTGDAGTVLVISRDIQNDPVSGKVIHVGFQRVSTQDPITAEVRVHLVGEPDDVRIGAGFVEQLLSTVSIRALPDRLPKTVEVDVTHMQVGSVLLASAVAEGREYALVTPADTVVAVCHSMTRGGDKMEEESEEEPVAAA